MPSMLSKCISPCKKQFWNLLTKDLNIFVVWIKEDDLVANIASIFVHLLLTNQALQLYHINNLNVKVQNMLK